MKPLELKPGLYWVGAVDWNKRQFHGYATSPLGTTYNNFLIVDDKVTLIDTVDAHFQDHLFCSLSQILGDRTIDYVVANHLEPDHSGCLRAVVEKYKPEKIFTSPMGYKAMQAHFHETDQWPVVSTPTGTSVSIGKRNLHFVETRMLHWPDSMATYCPEDKVLFCNDAFGQNIASSERYADEVDRFLLLRQMKEYYANIVLPFSPVVTKTLDALAEMKLDVDLLLPDHGLFFRGDDVAFAMDTYREYAEQKPTNKAVIVYDTMWNSTEKLGLAIAQGLIDAGVSVRVMCMKANHHTQVMTEVMDAAAVIIGSPTHNNTILPGMADVLTYMKGLRPKNKVGAVFGSFGWSGECVKILTEWLESMDMEIVEPGAVKAKHVPDHETYAKCYDLGQAVAARIKEKVGG